MAPGAVRQEPRQGRDQLGWLEQVRLTLCPNPKQQTTSPGGDFDIVSKPKQPTTFPGGDVPQGDPGPSPSLVPRPSSHREKANSDR